MEDWGVVPSYSYIAKLTSCPTCCDLDNRLKLPEGSPPWLPKGWGRNISEIDLSYHTLQLSGKAGCPICRILFDVFQHLRKKESRELDVSRAFVHLRLPRLDYGTYPFIHGIFEAPTLEVAGFPSVEWRNSLVFAVAGNGQPWPFRALPSGGYIPPYSCSDQCYRKLALWLADCINSHGTHYLTCEAPQTPSFMPTRLVDVGVGGDRPKVVRPGGTQASYIALSYCWGTVPFIKTTLSTLESLERGIDWRSLPATLRDCIVITRALGIRYLWIDALCIIQGEGGDWEQECSQMGRIYGKALLVVAADAMANVDGGLFARRPKSLRFECGPSNRSRKATCMLAHHLFDHQVLWEENAGAGNWPLAQRGWTLQERLLATRIVHFTPKEIVWECDHKVYCECKYHDWNPKDACYSSPKLQFLRALAPDASDDARAQYWCRIVRSFTGRRLTEDTDRLPAISGLARQFEDKGMGSYQAGIWSRYALRMISWHRSAEGSSVSRPKTYTAPSWSWASVVGPIDWEYDEEWEFNDLIKTDKSIYKAEIVRIECQTSGTDRFGRVSGGYLTLSAPMMTSVVKVISEGTVALGIKARHKLILDIDSPDASAELADGDGVKCLFLEKLVGDTASALVLKRGDSGPGIWQRVGRLFVNERADVPTLAVELVTIY